MNVYTTVDAPLPQGFSPSGVPDFTQEEFIASCFGSSFGYDGSFSQFDDSLLSPPEPSLDLTKLESIMDGKGLENLSDCGGVFDNYSDGMNLDPDWLHKSIALPTPDEQEGDITFTPSTPYTNITDVTLTITPDSSYPPTPLSTSPNSDVEEVLSLFSDQNCNNSTGYLPNEYLPFCQSFDSFDTDTSLYSSPALTPINSPVPSSYAQEELSSPSPLSQDNSCVAIKDLLAKKRALNSMEASQKQKRKSPKYLSGNSSAPKPKRRLNLTAKKERKREQNKTAALRYRQKKKDEKNVCVSKLDTLEAKNAELKKTVSSMTTEIEYLKKLWSEVATAKKLS